MKLNSDAEPANKIVEGDDIPVGKIVHFGTPLGDELASEMTKREAFALASLQGFLASDGDGESSVQSAVRVADLLIAELQK